MVNYSNVLTETSEILGYFDKSLLKKIPNNLIEKIKANANSQYKFTYDTTKELNDQKIMQETKDLISAIYLKYCCSKQEQQQLIEICKENERKELEILNQKVEINDIFKNRKQTKTVPEDNIEINNLPEKIETQNWYNILFQKVRNVINRIFKKVRGGK